MGVKNNVFLPTWLKTSARIVVSMFVSVFCISVCKCVCVGVFVCNFMCLCLCLCMALCMKLPEVLLIPHKHGSTYFPHGSHVLCHYMILLCMFYNMGQTHRGVCGEIIDTIGLLDEVRVCKVTWIATSGWCGLLCTAV